MPQQEPDGQNPAQYRRNNDLNRKAPAPRINVPTAGQLGGGQQCGTEAKDKEASAAGLGPWLQSPG